MTTLNVPKMQLTNNFMNIYKQTNNINTFTKEDDIT
jgi:hypothetical protein